MQAIVLCMSRETLELSTLIACVKEEVQACGDVIYPTVLAQSRASLSTLELEQQVQRKLYTITMQTSAGSLKSVVISFTLESEPDDDPPKFTLTCRSEGGPATTVEWRRDGELVQEDSNHMTSQMIVNTSSNTVYHNTLNVRGREEGTYTCNVSNNFRNFFTDSPQPPGAATFTLSCEL